MGPVGAVGGGKRPRLRGSADAPLCREFQLRDEAGSSRDERSRQFLFRKPVRLLRLFRDRDGDGASGRRYRGEHRDGLSRRDLERLWRLLDGAQCRRACLGRGAARRRMAALRPDPRGDAGACSDHGAWRHRGCGPPGRADRSGRQRRPSGAADAAGRAVDRGAEHADHHRGDGLRAGRYRQRLRTA